jgi:hypothetical protein
MLRQEDTIVGDLRDVREEHRESAREASSRWSTVVSFRASATTKPSGRLRIAFVN